MKWTLTSLLLASVTANAAQYRGYNVTSEESQIALCGTNVVGCLSMAHSRRCSTGSVHVGSLLQAGSNDQTWSYDAGLIRAGSAASSGWFGNYHRCLAPTNVYEEFKEDEFYTLTMHRCDESSPYFRFAFIEGRVQSLAPSEVPFCLTIAAEDASAAYGSSIFLQACNETNTLQQGIEPYGHIEPFLSPVQEKIGHQDMLKLVLWTEPTEGDQLAADDTVKVYHESDMMTPIYSTSMVGSSGVVEVNATEFGSLTGNFVASFGEMEVDFMVVSEDHVTGCSARSFASLPVVLGWPMILGISLALLGAVGLCAYVGIRRRRARQNADAEAKNATNEGDWKINDEEASQNTSSEASFEFQVPKLAVHE